MAGDSTATARELERSAENINPGCWRVSDAQPLSTLLGSCVAVCLFDARLRIGGLNHFMLPKTASPGAETDSLLHGDFAMEVLVNAMMTKGVHKNRMIAKAFGGGTIVSSIRMAIGERNVEFAREWLDREGIPLVASDFLGPWSRKIVFDPVTGDAYCRRIPVTQASALELAKAEQDYETAMAVSRTKRVELF